ncbi:hypothetical protein F5Y04DRAFT_276788 [Hypomontagnella monticulosa]|nr:hypothetical protein F5Y04DRAFT_276788 [Hypomontagnella monticulosa]
MSHGLFEAFETSAASEQALAAECLAAFLEQASTELLYSLQASAQKANISVTEDRDMTDLAPVT